MQRGDVRLRAAEIPAELVIIPTLWVALSGDDAAVFVLGDCPLVGIEPTHRASALSGLNPKRFSTGQGPNGRLGGARKRCQYFPAFGREFCITRGDETLFRPCNHQRIGNRLLGYFRRRSLRDRIRSEVDMPGHLRGVTGAEMSVDL